MRQAENIKEQLKLICGLKVQTVESEPRHQTVFCDEQNNRTVFTVPTQSKTLFFAVEGCGEAQRTIASLAREIALGIVGKADGDPVKDFLLGSGEAPQGVHVGKADYYVFAIFSSAREKNVREYLMTMADRTDFVAEMGDGITAFCKKADNDSDYRSAGEFAEVLKENLAEEIKGEIKIGVGGVAHGASELPQFYSYAQSALVGGAEYDPQSDIYSYKEYALIKSLSALPPVAMEKYVKTVLDRNYHDVLCDDELMTAADAFLKHSLNISEASRSMFVHRNTLIYRLDKIEKATGLNIRNFNDAMTFRVACLLFKML